MAVRAALLISAAALLVALLAGCGLIAGGRNHAVGPADLPPDAEHICGTDRLGRSVLDKLLAATPGTVGSALAGAAIATVLGTLVGVAAGLGRGLADECAVWLLTTVGSIPGILLMIGLSLAFSAMPVVAGHNGLALALALGLTGWIGTARLIRSEVRARQGSRMVEAARGLGLGPLRIWWSYIRPQTTHLVIIEGASHLAGFIHAGVVLSFLGAGPADALSWGSLIDEGRTDLARGAWWQVAAAAGAVLAVAVSTHILADALRDRLDPATAPSAQRGRVSLSAARA